MSYEIRTGDGKVLQVGQDITLVSDLFIRNKQIYFENSSEASIQLVIEFAEYYNKFSTKQKTKWDNPIQLIEKIGKSNQSEADRRQVEIMDIYKKLPAKEFFELLKTAKDMHVMVLVQMLTFITSSRIINKTTHEIEKMFMASAKEKWV